MVCFFRDEASLPQVPIPQIALFSVWTSCKPGHGQTGIPVMARTMYVMWLDKSVFRGFNARFMSNL